MNALILMAFLHGVPVVAPSAPQLPFAAGSLESILVVARAAVHCGVQSQRLEVGPGWATPSHARLFYDEPVGPRADHCVAHWTTREGRHLGLEPPWWGDTFESDAPKFVPRR